MPKLSRRSWKALILFFVLAFCVGAQWAFSQASISAGNIVGTVTDESGAIVPGAKVTITNKGTGQQLTLIANSSGIYNSGPSNSGGVCRARGGFRLHHYRGQPDGSR